MPCSSSSWGHLHGVSTRKIDDLVRVFGADSGISESEVSRIFASLDEEIGVFHDRSRSDLKYSYVPRRDVPRTILSATRRGREPTATGEKDSERAAHRDRIHRQRAAISFRTAVISSVEGLAPSPL